MGWGQEGQVTGVVGAGGGGGRKPDGAGVVGQEGQMAGDGDERGQEEGSRGNI